MRKSCLITMLLATTLCVAGCASDGQQKTESSWQNSATTSSAGVYRLHKSDLERLGLETAWATNRLIDTPDATVIQAYPLGEFILLETSDRKLYGIDRNTGTPMWREDLPYRSDFPACIEDGYIYLTCRNMLVAIDKRGTKEWTKLMKHAPGGSPAANASHIFIPCLDGRLRSFLKVSGKAHGYFDRQLTTGGRIEAKPIVSQTLVYAASHDGFVYALDVEKLECSWKFKTYDRIIGDVVLKGTRLFVASNDGSLYCLNSGPMETRQQQLDWHQPYASGASISQTPYVTRDLAMIVNHNNECHAVDVDHGRRRWLVPNVTRVLTQGRLNTYLLRGESKVVAVDNQTGNHRWELDTSQGGFSFILTNTQDDLIYMICPDGSIQAIRERKPVVKEKPVPVEGADEDVIEEGDIEIIE